MEGLPASIFALESIDFLIEYIVTGVIFGAIPAMWLAPRLYGKVEPLMGMKPRSPEEKTETSTGTWWGIIIGGTVVAGVIAVLSEIGINIVEWEPEFLDSIGEWWIWVGIALAAVVAGIILFIANRNKSNS